MLLFQPSDKTTNDISPSELSQKIAIQKPINYGQKCRDMIEEIKTLTYLLEDDEDVMKDLQTNLETIRNYLAFLIHERNQAPNADIYSEQQEMPSWRLM